MNRKDTQCAAYQSGSHLTLFLEDPATAPAHLPAHWPPAYARLPCPGTSSCRSLPPLAPPPQCCPVAATNCKGLGTAAAKAVAVAECQLCRPKAKQSLHRRGPAPNVCTHLHVMGDCVYKIDTKSSQKRVESTDGNSSRRHATRCTSASPEAPSRGRKDTKAKHINCHGDSQGRGITAD